MSRAAAPTPAPEGDVVGFDRIGLGIGSMLRLHAQEPDARHYHVQLIGLYRDKGFITTLPVSGDKELWMTPGSTYVFHVLAGTHVHAFTSQVMIARAHPYPHVHFEYPAGMQSQKVRKSHRVRMALDVLLSGTGGAEPQARVVDLSLNGALLELAAPVEGDTLRMTLPIHLDEAQKDLSIEAAIRNREAPGKAGRPWRIGVEFGDISEQDRLLLHYFIDHTRAASCPLGT